MDPDKFAGPKLAAPKFSTRPAPKALHHGIFRARLKYHGIIQTQLNPLLQATLAH